MTRVAKVVGVIGGGFYGCSIAHLLASEGMKVHLFECNNTLLARASYSNQARLHGGYHYPRSFSTAYRSRYHFTRFYEDFKPAIKENFVKLYAIARYGKVSATQFARFCDQIQAPLKIARKSLQQLFVPRLIEQVYEVEEYAYDAAILRRLLLERLEQAKVNVQCSTKVINLDGAKMPLELTTQTTDSHQTIQTLPVDLVVNCTYAGLNSISGVFQSRQGLKHELAEIALFEPPSELKNISVTVMDGPFFSFMPFPDLGLTSLTHVRYTPHTAIEEGSDEAAKDPYAYFNRIHPRTTYPYMIRDAARYMPALADGRYDSSLFEVKTVLKKNEKDDGRPILFEYDSSHPAVVSMLGSKLDNIYDAHAALLAHIENMPTSPETIMKVPSQEKMQEKISSSSAATVK